MIFWRKIEKGVFVLWLQGGGGAQKGHYSKYKLTHLCFYFVLGC